MNKLNERSLRNLKGIHPDLAKLMHEAIKECPVPFIITCGVRTSEEQQKLYAQGRTAPGFIVTHCDGINKKSKHQVKADGYGWAVDLYPDTNNNGKLDQNEINDAGSLKIIGSHIKELARQMGISISWGGDWKVSKDYPHFELEYE